MAHDTASVAGVQNPTNAFGESIAGVDDASNVFKDNVASAFPILDREELNVDVTGSFSGAASVYHFDGRLIVLVECSRARLRESQLGKDKAQILGHFGSGDGRAELSLSATSCGDGLGFTTIGNGASSESEDVSSGGTAKAKVIGVGCIHVTSKLEGVQKARKRRERRGIIGLEKRNMGKQRGNRSRAPELDTPINSIAQILGNIFKTKKMDTGGLFRKFFQGGDGIANVRASGDVGIK